MLTQNEIINFLSDHKSNLKMEYNISKIGLFGSFARNEQNEQSDVDILLEFEPGTKNIYEKKTKLKEFLKTTFQRDVDLCREKYVKPYVKDYLINEVIYV
jgi:predicted nucleotidyltransferase